MKTHIDNVEKFMKLAGQSVPDTPTIPTEKDRKLRAKLIMEEALETIDGLGITVSLNGVYLGPNEPFSYDAFGVPDLSAILDGCVDMLWVGPTGTAIACGMKSCIVPAIKEVDRSNLSKFIDGHKDPSGKWIKGPSYSPPNLEEIIANACYST